MFVGDHRVTAGRSHVPEENTENATESGGGEKEHVKEEVSKGGGGGKKEHVEEEKKPSEGGGGEEERVEEQKPMEMSPQKLEDLFILTQKDPEKTTDTTSSDDDDETNIEFVVERS